jgi:hypothetical protein
VVAWNAARQQPVCRSCGTDAQLAEPAGTVEHFPLLPRLADRPDSGRDWQPRPTHLRCRSCQSVVEREQHVVGRACDACGTPALVPSDATGAPVMPSGVLPFRLSEVDARARLAEWLKSSHVRRTLVDTVRGLYLPCWVFNARVSCRYRGERERRNSDGEAERIAIDGLVELTFDDYLIPASSTVDAADLTAISPFPAADMRAYDTRYLAGFTTEMFTRNMWDSWDEASARMEKELNAALAKDSKCYPSTLETWPEWRDHRGALVLVPAYVITYRHKKKEYRGVVNGWTGETTGSRPWVPMDLLVLGILLTVLAAIVYGLYWLYSWLNP